MQPDFSQYSVTELRALSKAGEDVLEALRVLQKAGANTVSRVIENYGEFYEMEHYPPGDVYDEDSASQYYYHAHRTDSEEHGHFHTFIRADAIPTSMIPFPYDGEEDIPTGEDTICHLIAVSMDDVGLPIALFTTNQWVTGETFFNAEDAIELLKKFDIDHVYPCLGTNRWLSAMLRLFRPQIELLLLERDKVIEDYIASNPDRDVFGDEDLEIISLSNINIEEQIRHIKEALNNKGDH